MNKPTRYALVTFGLFAAVIAVGPIALAQDKPATPPAAGHGAMNDDHMMNGSMTKMMERMNGMMDRCDKIMERHSSKRSKMQL
jgi:hypothetical protein